VHLVVPAQKTRERLTLPMHQHGLQVTHTNTAVTTEA
jgi:hypothetical protein